MTREDKMFWEALAASAWSWITPYPWPIDVGIMMLIMTFIILFTCWLVEGPSHDNT